MLEVGWFDERGRTKESQPFPILILPLVIRVKRVKRVKRPQTFKQTNIDLLLHVSKISNRPECKKSESWGFQKLNVL